MNSLKLIEKEIRRRKASIRKLEEQPPHVRKYFLIAEKKAELQTLEQIKAELEAWESIKPYLVVKKMFVNLYENDFATIELKNGCIDELESGEDYENANKILKALEVKDD